MIIPWLHAVTPECESLLECVQIAVDIHPYVDAIHVRQKQWTARMMWDAVEQYREAGIPQHKLIVNDRVDVAAAANLRGVQLAYHSLPPHAVRAAFAQLLMGVSVHDEREARQAEQQGADYIIYGHVFPTACKPGREPKGEEALRRCRQAITIPIVAIGGITYDNIGKVISAGASGVAVMSGIWHDEHPALSARRYRESLMAAVQGTSMLRS
ncbi:thiamine phosphate synthase [Paenibacillus sp. MER TA 81-3]|uniref:thiamine phosphate synthase n=1 Tax=Paenibacillus sp. MER TA 81-3 TaxID=2939573 RepID=UPI00203C5DB0|nr:thiamine phosphate synthase [Paenibacillus sp. MER TA 81-3]MCM3339911.1 thiamine phosphate synthase [Paenibacillus sp. MER TA 81-3]